MFLRNKEFDGGRRAADLILFLDLHSSDLFDLCLLDPHLLVPRHSLLPHPCFSLDPNLHLLLDPDLCCSLDPCPLVPRLSLYLDSRSRSLSFVGSRSSSFVGSRSSPFVGSGSCLLLDTDLCLSLDPDHNLSLDSDLCLWFLPDLRLLLDQFFVIESGSDVESGTLLEKCDGTNRTH